MRRICLTILAAILQVGTVVWASPPEIEYLSFSARDQNEIYVRDLRIDEVELLIDQKPVPIRLLGYKNTPTAFLFLMENSPRTAQYPVSVPQLGQINTIDQLRYQLVSGFFWPLLEVGPVMLAHFYQDFEILQGFTEQVHQLEDSLLRLEPHFMGLDREKIPVARMIGRAMDRLLQRPERRKILVLFTATVDRESYKSLEEYRQLLRMSDVELYVVTFAARFPSTTGASFEQTMNGYYFQNLVKETSGKLYFTEQLSYLEDSLLDLRSRLTNSYTIGFNVEPASDPTEHEVQITIDREKSEVAHRKVLIY
jgi:hypothetical protein